MRRRNLKQLMTPARVRRLGAKLHRLAYEFEHDANRLLIEGDDDFTRSCGNSILAISSTLGGLGRKMENR